jgi:hypothetical protein
MRRVADPERGRDRSRPPAHDVDWNYGGRSASMRTMNLSGSTKYVPADPEPAATGAKTDHTQSHHH